MYLLEPYCVAELRVYGYAIYTGIDSELYEQENKIRWKTRQAVVFREKRTQRYLTPASTLDGNLKIVGNWSHDTSQGNTEYSMLKGKVSSNSWCAYIMYTLT